MKYEIVGKPDFPCVRILLKAEESVVAESGAMISMSSNVELKSSAKGGLFSSAKRAMLGGESFFQSTFTAHGGSGEVYFASETTGDLEHISLSGDELIMSTGAYVCGSPELELDSKWGGFKGFFGGEGLFFLKVRGVGDLFFSSFGAIHEISVKEEYVVDTGHIVAFDPSLTYNIEKVGGLKSLFFSGEGLVCRFSGKGKLYIQTRNQNSFASWANQFRRVESKN
ncbi:MAG: TIGR00266 family protein [Spirochaetes bacterium]|jgi:uncharacterized protein (TIGR00266 family)|nr:TIGR00266 family protein [Spirochaetota bacterium]